MKPKQREEIKQAHHADLIKTGFGVLDEIICPCDSEESKICKEYNGFYPHHCKTVKDLIANLIK